MPIFFLLFNGIKSPPLYFMKFFLQLRIKIIKSVVVRSILVVVVVAWSIVIAVVIITLVIFRLHEVSKIDHSGHGGGCQGGLDRERKGGMLGWFLYTGLLSTD